MSTHAESVGGTAEIQFIRDPDKPGYVHVVGILFDDEDAYRADLGTYSIRELQTALSGLTPSRLVDKAPIGITAPVYPLRRYWWWPW